MAENRYIYRNRYRRERRQLHQLDRDMRFNGDVDRWDRHLVESRRQHKEPHQQALTAQ